MKGTTTYTIRVESHLDGHWSPRLADLAILHNEDGTTTLTGPLADQAQLHGVLATLRDINAVLLELHASGARSSFGSGIDADQPVDEVDGTSADHVSHGEAQ